MIITLTPAYGRDYKSKKALLEDWNADKDFIVAGVIHPSCGKPANRQDLKNDGIKSVNIRYSNLRKVAVVTL